MVVPKKIREMNITVLKNDILLDNKDPIILDRQGKQRRYPSKIAGLVIKELTKKEKEKADPYRHLTQSQRRARIRA